MAERPNTDDTYEFFVTDAEFKTAGTGTKYTNCTFTIRSDVDQNGKGWKVYYNFWKKKDGSYDQVFTENEAKFNTSVGVSGEALAKNPEKWAEVIKGKAVRARLQEDSYNGKTRFTINPFTFEASKITGKEEAPPVVDDPFQSKVKTTDFANFSEDDLPF